MSDEAAGRGPVLIGERVTLRPGEKADAEWILRIRREPEVWHWWRDVSPEEVAADLLGRDDARFLVVEVGGEVVGGIQYSEETDPDYRHAGIDIFLGRDFQGHGLGAEAIRLLAGYLIRDRGHHRLVIDPASTNGQAIRCYSSVGFRSVGTMRRYERGNDGSWHDGLLMDLLADEFTASHED